MTFRKKMSTLPTSNISSNIFQRLNKQNSITNKDHILNATIYFNNSWIRIEETAASLIAAGSSWLETNNLTNSSSLPSTQNINNIPKLNVTTMETPGSSINRINIGSGSVGNTPDIVANIFANFINATTMTTLNATSLLYPDDGLTAVTTETPYVPYVMRPETYIVPVLFAFIFIVGVLGNGTLIFIFLAVRQMRNVPNTYIFSLALADLLVIVITVPLTSTVYTVDSWPWGSFLCTLTEFIKDVSIGVSVFTLTALSGDRYFAIVKPLRKFHGQVSGTRATRMAIIIAVSIWLLAILCGLPALIGTYVKKWGWDYAKTMVLLRFLVYYAIPLVIIGIFYALIARHLMYAANIPGEMQGALKQVRDRRRVALSVLAFVVIFGVCFLPIHVFMLWFYYWPTAQEDYNYFWHVLRIAGFCMSFANSCANPVALYFVSGQFRKQFNRYLFCEGSRILCKHHDSSLTTSRRCYHSTRSCFQQSTIRSRFQETSITMVTNGNNHSVWNNDVGIECSTTCSGTGTATGNCSHDDTIEVALTSDCCHQHEHSHQFM